MSMYHLPIMNIFIVYYKIKNDILTPKIKDEIWICDFSKKEK